MITPHGPIEAGEIADDAVTTAKILDDAVTQDKLDTEVLDVTVTAGGPTGTATCTSGALIIGCYPVSNQDQFIDSVIIAATTLTVTLAANATADNVFKVVCLKP